MTAQSSTTSVELPPGVSHHATTATAETWHAYDALTEADGWEERTWPVDRNDTYPAGIHTQKEAEIRGQRIVVFPPSQPLPVETVARDILAESMTPIVTPEEDEAFNGMRS